MTFFSRSLQERSEPKGPLYRGELSVGQLWAAIDALIEVNESRIIIRGIRRYWIIFMGG